MTDPDQLDNVAATVDPNLVAVLSDRIRALADCAAKTCRALEEDAIAPFDAAAYLHS